MRALKDVEDTIGKLNAQLELLLTEPRMIADHQNRAQNVPWELAEPYLEFCQFFEELKTEEKGNICHLALEKLWKHFRDPIPDLDDRIEDAQDPGDGLLYGPEDINRANWLLKDLHQAWTNRDDDLYPPPENLCKMGMICLVLVGMKQQQLLEDFLDSRVCDDDLHLSRARLQQILRKEHLEYVGTFLSEQYRAKPRVWDEGHHAKLEDKEPLPLEHGRPYKMGSYGIVIRVRDPVSGTLYALKKQIVSPVESENARARTHLKDETQRLHRLQHKHVIRLVKSYERANSYGLLLAPAATSDLLGLFNRFHKNKWCAPEQCLDQTWLRPIFLTAFGCLSQGLAYVHGKEIRHKDIKPGNILFERGMRENDGARFLWADFGLAYDFSATGNSKTDSTKIYSKRYAAPEILKTSIDPTRTERHASMKGLAQISENEEASKPEEKILSHFKYDIETGHGRKTDIFSLGCVFLELLAVLVRERLPMDRSKWTSGSKLNIVDGQPPYGGRIAVVPVAGEDDIFCEHITQLKVWAQSHSASSNTQNHDPGQAHLGALFDLAAQMISWKADDRPIIDDVVYEIAAIGKDYFCQSCWAELPSQYKVTKSTE